MGTKVKMNLTVVLVLVTLVVGMVGACAKPAPAPAPAAPKPAPAPAPAPKPAPAPPPAPKIDVIKNRETEYAKKAEEVTKNIIRYQKLDVDVISGASTTSKALLKAVENALTGE